MPDAAVVLAAWGQSVPVPTVDGALPRPSLRPAPSASPPPSPPKAWNGVRRLLALSSQLLRRRDARLVTLLPFQAAYGILDAVHTTYVNAQLARASVGVSSLGYLAALVVATAALMSPPLAWLAVRYGKALIMGACLGTFALRCVVLLVLPAGVLVGAGWLALVPVYVFQGLGRAVYETTNKAIIADAFRHTEARAAAFSVAIFVSGGTTAAGMFVLRGPADTAAALNAVLGVCIALVVISVALSWYQSQFSEHLHTSGLQRASP